MSAVATGVQRAGAPSLASRSTGGPAVATLLEARAF
jgi:hypothetical protein